MRWESLKDAGDLVAEIHDHVGLLPGMLFSIAGLSKEYNIGFVSDYPRQWQLPIIERTGLLTYFTEEDMVVLAEHDIPDTYHSLFKFLVCANFIVPGSSLWVDHNSLRTSVAIRQGIDTIHFVDAERLHRDLGLWELEPSVK